MPETKFECQRCGVSVRSYAYWNYRTIPPTLLGAGPFCTYCQEEKSAMFVIQLDKQNPRFKHDTDYWVGPLKELERAVEWSPSREHAMRFATREAAEMRAAAMRPLAEARAVPA